MALYRVFIGSSKLNHTGNCVINYVCTKGREYTIKGGYTSYFLLSKAYFLLSNRTKTPSQTLKKGIFRAVNTKVRIIPKVKLRQGTEKKLQHHNTRLLRGAQTYSVRTQLYRYTDNSYSGAPPRGGARGCPEADCSKVEYKDKTIGKK